MVREKRNDWLGIRVASEEKRRIKANAEAAGMEPAEYIRSLALAGPLAGAPAAGVRVAVYKTDQVGPDPLFAGKKDLSA